MKTRVVALVFVVMAIAAVARAGEEGIPNRLAAAKVGEWVLYKIPGGYTQKQTVVKREGDGAAAKVTVRVDNIYEGQVANSHEMTDTAGTSFAPLPPTDSGVKLSVSKEKITVKGKTIDAVKLDKDNGESVWYLSPEIPVYGVIKVISHGSETCDLIDYGDA